MQEAEFEEKDFESPLYNQLLYGTNLIATPGQVFEGAFGIDAALQADHPVFWDWFGFPDIPLGVRLADFRWGWIWRRVRRVRPLPTFAVNLLVQAKRPDWLKGTSSRLTRHAIGGSYWRFKIKAKQQDLLSRVSRTLSNRALVVYASTAFHTLAALYDHTTAGTIVENCSFVRIERMQNHWSWNYNKPGTSGVAMSDPEFIDDVPFIQALEQLSNSERQDPLAELKSLELLLLSAIQEADDNPLAQFIMRVDKDRDEVIEALNVEVSSGVRSFVRLRLIFSLLGVSWFIIG